MSKRDKIYYHGTETRRAYTIMTQGFKRGTAVHGQRLGRGLYISQQLASARFWSHDIVIRCRLQRGTRILWIQEGYDHKIIDHLGKEFGKELLAAGPQFHKAIPRNKQLTKRELIALCNYVFETRQKKSWQYALRARKGKRARYWNAWEELSWLHEHVRRHGYDALGDRSYQTWDSDEILVFNPSRVTPISAHRLQRLFSEDRGVEFEKVIVSPAIDLAQLREISAQAQAEYE